MELTLKRYVPLLEQYPSVGSDLLDPATWDELRLETDASEFSIPTDHESWVEACENTTSYARRAQSLVTLLKDAGIERALSVGVGSAALEYHLQNQYPRLDLVISDYSPKSVARLQDITTEFEAVVEFDILRDNLDPWTDRCFIIHRVDTDLTDSEWKKVFERLKRQNIEFVVFVPGGVLTLRTILRTLAGTIRARLPSRRYTFAGYVRTLDRMKSLWESCYSIRRSKSVGGTPSYLLEVES